MKSDNNFIKVVGEVKRRSPLVVQITNFVSASFQAASTLAIGAHPMMPVSEMEIEEILSKADSLLVNIGTIDEGRMNCIRRAIRYAKDEGIPVVLDPVGCGVSEMRRKLVFELLNVGGICIVKGNAGEILSIYGLGGLAKGVDSAPYDVLEGEVENIVRSLALNYNCVFAMTGRENIVSDGSKVSKIVGGERIMAYVTGMGCALGSIMAAFLTVVDPWLSAICALELFSEISKRAYSKSKGPGSFKESFLDELYLLWEGYV
ncbi:MAG: hydroxyethylthiazole kinase [Synergistetes bacterium]|nr:hydroxyethylthiazole kinase [Synergistota bacterium]MCX8128334.1 hydroxyethylthiazole kinase [Synergistota bacterium]MDW8193007.1 hydroxyethylthiazole kinase [Synergistota bacterium]